MGIEEEELQPLVTAWRQSNPNITKLWWDVDRAVKTCVKQKLPQRHTALNLSIKVECSSLSSLLADGLPM